MGRRFVRRAGQHESHTGCVTSFGTVGLLAKYTNHRFYTKRSTEAELLGDSDYLPHALQNKLIKEAQSQIMCQCFLEQDTKVQ
jgi:hypothetical protein